MLFPSTHDSSQVNLSMTRTVLFFSLCAGLILPAPAALPDCATPALAHQLQNAATVQRLEDAWSVAYLTGDTGFETCLLMPDFTEIMGNGAINHLSDELALAEKNRGKTASGPPAIPITVDLHGDVAVAYGLSPEQIVDGKRYRHYFADYYLWGNGRWHVFFSQQTKFSPS